MVVSDLHCRRLLCTVTRVGCTSNSGNRRIGIHICSFPPIYIIIYIYITLLISCLIVSMLDLWRILWYKYMFSFALYFVMIVNNSALYDPRPLVCVVVCRGYCFFRRIVFLVDVWMRGSRPTRDGCVLLCRSFVPYDTIIPSCSVVLCSYRTISYNFY